MHVISKSFILVLWIHTLTFAKSQEAQRCGHPGIVQFASFHLEGGDEFVVGSQVVYSCKKGYVMVSRTNARRCTTNGWDGVVPQCEAQPCPFISVKNNVQVLGNAERTTYASVFRFRCTSRGEVLKGAAKIYCDETGNWSGNPPTCEGPVNCSNPLHLDNGDFLGNTKPQYAHNERVEYSCQPYYKMEGERYRICRNGVWTGQMRCIKPCSVTEDDLTRHSIDLKNKNSDTTYVKHEDYIEFNCKPGKARVGNVAMRQRCDDGVMTLPTCQ